MLPSTADLDTFHAQRGNTDWLEADAAEKSPAIFKAFDYIAATYSINGFENDPRITLAVKLLAPEMLGNALRVRAADQAVLSEEEGIGSGALTEKRTYSKPTDDPYPLITSLLADFPKRSLASAYTTSGNRLKIVRLVRGY